MAKKNSKKEKTKHKDEDEDGPFGMPSLSSDNGAMTDLFREFFPSLDEFVNKTNGPIALIDSFVKYAATMERIYKERNFTMTEVNLSPTIITERNVFSEIKSRLSMVQSWIAVPLNGGASTKDVLATIFHEEIFGTYDRYKKKVIQEEKAQFKKKIINYTNVELANRSLLNIQMVKMFISHFLQIFGEWLPEMLDLYAIQNDVSNFSNEISVQTNVSADHFMGIY